MADEKTPQTQQRRDDPQPRREVTTIEKVETTETVERPINDAGVQEEPAEPPAPLAGSTNPPERGEADKDNPDDGVEYAGVDPQFKNGRPGDS